MDELTQLDRSIIHWLKNSKTQFYKYIEDNICLTIDRENLTDKQKEKWKF